MMMKRILNLERQTRRFVAEKSLVVKLVFFLIISIIIIIISL